MVVKFPEKPPRIFTRDKFKEIAERSENLEAEYDPGDGVSLLRDKEKGQLIRGSPITFGSYFGYPPLKKPAFELRVLDKDYEIEAEKIGKEIEEEFKGFDLTVYLLTITDD